MHGIGRAAAALVLVLAVAACGPTGERDVPQPTVAVVPAPVSAQVLEGEPFRLGEDARIVAADGDAAAPAELLAGILREPTGFALPVVAEARDGDVVLQLDPDHAAAAGGQAAGAYTLTSTATGVAVVAADAEGLFNGVQTLRQLLPAEIELAPADVPAGVAWEIPALEIDDAPRFAYRGAMLDVARHFFSVAEVQRYVDDIARLKINHLHLHLTDDQGWRLAIDGWPELTGVGAALEVGGTAGGFYTADDYRAIVEYAQARGVTVVPEIDLPGHTSAALAAYPELSCDGEPREPYTGIEVGFSSLCLTPGSEAADRSRAFVADVLAQVAALTPGPYVHIGGDEASSTVPTEYAEFMALAAGEVAAAGKTPVGWQEVAGATALPADAVGQYWGLRAGGDQAADDARALVDAGHPVLVSPADVAYLDMKYAETEQLGLLWAGGVTTLEEAASWDPADLLGGLEDADVLGVEAPLWSETLTDIDDIEYMAFPRLAAIAEIAWSPRPDDVGARFELLEPRVGALVERWAAAGIRTGPDAG